MLCPENKPISLALAEQISPAVRPYLPGVKVPREIRMPGRGNNLIDTAVSYASLLGKSPSQMVSTFQMMDSKIERVKTDERITPIVYQPNPNALLQVNYKPPPPVIEYSLNEQEWEKQTKIKEIAYNNNGGTTPYMPSNKEQTAMTLEAQTPAGQTAATGPPVQTPTPSPTPIPTQAPKTMGQATPMTAGEYLQNEENTDRENSGIRPTPTKVKIDAMGRYKRGG